jgi:uncharacterized protein (DUF1778 family)
MASISLLFHGQCPASVLPAAAALGTDRSSFLLSQGRLAAQQVLADREHFVLDAAAQQEWERINSCPARVLPGLKRLLERPSPFVPQA